MKKWLKETDVLDLLGISKSTLWRLVRQGKINKYKVSRLNRYDSDEIVQYMKGIEK